MMTIFINYDDIHEFKQIIKDNNVQHGPFRIQYSNSTNKLGYYIDILDFGHIETYLRLKYN